MISREIVGPVIGADLQRRGIYATLASIVAITLYIAFRFRFSFAVGAIAATFHDIFVTLAFLMFFGYELSLNVVAAILTITGYSVNDTIVDLRSRPRKSALDAARTRSSRSSIRASTRRWRGRSSPRAPRFSGGAVAVSVRRRGAPRVRVHDARRHRQRHLFHYLHRFGDRDHPEPAAACGSQRGGRAAGAPGRPEARPGRKTRGARAS